MVRVEVCIVEAQGLPAADMNGKSDPYCQISSSAERFKTEVCKNTLNPIWRETKVVNVMNPANDGIGFLIFDWDRLSANDIIAYGFISLIGVPPNGMPLDHWIPLFKKKKKDNKVQKVAKKVAGVPKPGIPGGRLHIVVRLLDVAPTPMAAPMAAPMGAYPPQPMPGQPMPGQPYYPQQPMPGQPMPGQPYYPQQPMPGQPMPGQPYYPPQPMPGQPMMAPPMGAPMGPMAVPPGALVIQVPYKGAPPIGFQNKSGHLRPKKTDGQVPAHAAGKGAKKTLKVLGKLL